MLKGLTNQQQTGGAAIRTLPVYRILITQFAVVLFTSAILLAFDLTSAYSFVLGGIISIGPNAYFAHCAFRHAGAQAARQVVLAFYRGEAGKFMLTAGLFAMAFIVVKPLNAPALFGGFVLATAANGIGAAYLTRRGRRPQ